MSNTAPPNENPTGNNETPEYGDADNPTTRLPETTKFEPQGNDDPTTRMPQTQDFSQQQNFGQPYEAAGGQGQPPAPNQYQQPGVPGPNAPMNTLSTVGFILAFIAAPVGAILSHVSLSQIKKRFERGRGLAIAGIIIGWVITAFWLFIIIFTLIVGITAANQVQTALDELESTESAPQTPGEEDLGAPAEPEDENATEPEDSGAADGEAPSAEFCAVIGDAVNLDFGDEAGVTDFYKQLADTRGGHPNQQLYGDAYDAIKTQDIGKITEIEADLQNAIMEDSLACEGIG